MEKKQSTLSYIMMISAMLVFGTIGIFRRYIPLSSGLLACARGFLGAGTLILFVKVRGKKLFHKIETKKLLLLILSGLFMGANWIFLFEAYNHTTVAVATLCYYMEPTIVICMSPLILKEKISLKQWICVAVSLIGMVLVSGVLSGDAVTIADFIGVFLGLAAAVLYSSVVLMNKKITIEDPYEKTVIQLLSAAILMIPYLLLTEDFSEITFTTQAIVMLLIVGIIHTGISYALYFSAMQKLPARSVAVLSYIDPVSALILSAIFLDEKMSVLAVIGAVLIIGAALVSEWRFKKA